MYIEPKQFNLHVIDELNKVINIAKQFVISSIVVYKGET